MDIKQYLNDKEIQFKELKNGYLVLKDCIFCDGKDKLYVNLTNKDRPEGFTKCFKCGTTVMFDKLIKELSNISGQEASLLFKGEVEETKLTPEQELFNSFDKLEIKTETVTDRINKFGFIKEAKLIRIPKIDVEDVSLLSEGINYLIKRGLKNEDLSKLEVVIFPSDYELVKKTYIADLNETEKFDLFKAMKKIKEKQELNEAENDAYEDFRKLYNLTGRVVFPVKIGKKTIGYVARDYTGKADKKVLNSTGPMSSDFFWNFNNVSKSNQVVVLEGIFSAISCGINRSIAVLGMNSILGDNKLRLMKSIKPEEYVIFFDPGAMESSGKLAAELAKTESNVRVVIPPSIIQCKELVNINEIYDNGIEIHLHNNSKNQYYLAHTDYQLMKLSIKLMNFIRLNDTVNERKILSIIEQFKQSNPSKRKRFYFIHGKVKNSGSMEKEVRKLTEGSYLDANDLGTEICKQLIDIAEPFSAFIDYKKIDDRIIKYVQKDNNKICLSKSVDFMEEPQEEMTQSNDGDKLEEE